MLYLVWSPNKKHTVMKYITRLRDSFLRYLIYMYEESKKFHQRVIAIPTKQDNILSGTIDSIDHYIDRLLGEM